MKIRKSVAYILGIALLAGMFVIDAPTAGVRADELSGYTAAEIVSMMGMGFNLGNSLDATGGGKSTTNIYAQETSWGNPQITQQQIDYIAEAGFTSIRIPVTWTNYIDKENNYKINEAFMARVGEVVDYAYNDNLFVIINLHHESWLENKNLIVDADILTEEIEAVWAQIADYFADYDQHLIFEGMNEARVSGTNFEWVGNAASYEVINRFNSAFVNTVRSSKKGHNGERALMIPGYAAQCSANVLEALEIPEVDGKPAENIVISVHGYTPYDFCLSDNQDTFSSDKVKDRSSIDSMFKTIYNKLLSKGLPVVLGETGATKASKFDNVADRENWAEYMTYVAASYGVPAFIWDNGSNSQKGERHAYLNRRSSKGEWYYPTVIAAFIGGGEKAEWNSATEQLLAGATPIPTPTNVPVETPTPEPTATPVPTATPKPTATQMPAPTEAPAKDAAEETTDRNVPLYDDVDPEFLRNPIPGWAYAAGIIAIVAIAAGAAVIIVRKNRKDN